MIHKINVFLLSLIIALLPAYVFANNLGGWAINSRLAQGASLVLNASKNVMINGSNLVKTSTAKITPAATNVAKILRGGVAGYALSIAVEQLLGSVDWVLDPANNQIVYKVPSSDPDAPTNEFYYQIPYNGFNTLKFSTADSACLYAFSAGLADAVKNTYPFYSHTLNGQCYLTQIEGTKGTFVFSDVAKVANPNYDSEAEQEKKLGLDTVAAKVISNAETETDSEKKAAAQEATTAAAEDMLANDSATQNKVREQLETNARTQTSEEAQAETKPKDPTAPEAGSDISIKFPVFCTWAPVVCEAAQIAISFPTKLTEWWVSATLAISTAYTEAKEWVTAEPEPTTENSQIDIVETPVIAYTYEQHVSFGAACPFTPETTVIDFGIASFSVDHDFTIVCDVASDMRPYVVSISHLGALLYLIYAIRNGNG